MKRILLVLMMLALTVIMITGCRSEELGSLSVSDDVDMEMIDYGDVDLGKDESKPSESEKKEETPSEKKPEKPNDSVSKPEDTPKPDDTQKPDSNPKEEAPSADEKEEEPIFEEEIKIDYSDWITVATFNVKSFFDGQTADSVVAEIGQVDPDIIGLQEISVYNPEKDNLHQIEFLAEKLGYPYWDFVSCSGGSGKRQYGHGMLSKYPIKSREDVSYNHQADGRRKYGRYILEIEGREVAYYNTHLATEGKGLPQYKELLKRAYSERIPTIITGDFNLKMEEQREVLDRKRLMPMNGLESMTIEMDRNLTLDNIYISIRHFEHYMDESETYGIQYISSDTSDHDLIWTYLKLK